MGQDRVQWRLLLGLSLLWDVTRLRLPTFRENLSVPIFKGQLVQPHQRHLNHTSSLLSVSAALFIMLCFMSVSAALFIMSCFMSVSAALLIVSCFMLQIAGHRSMFCYHCPPSLHPSATPRLPSLDYPFTPTHPCKYTVKHMTKSVQLSRTPAAFC